MRGLVLIFISIWAISSYGQCTDCTSFDEALKAPETVKTLKINPWLGNATLDSLPVSIGKFVNAERIYISDHNISVIPREIANLTNLRELSLAGCKLTVLPEEIFLLKNLTLLILLDNEFSTEYIKKIKERFRNEMPNTKLLISGAE